MKILHTADWHLGQRLGRVDRSEDLRLAVERVMGLCESHAVDVLIIAGDLFHSVRRADDLRDAIGHLEGAVRPFLRRGGTILAVTGNHDGETFCRTLQHTLGLADPSEAAFGDAWPAGRFHLATREAFLRLADPASGDEVQFVLMPYPTPTRYLDDVTAPFEGGAEGKNRRVLEGFRDRLASLWAHPRFRADLPSVLVSHLFLQGATLPNGREVTEEWEKDDVVAGADDLGAGWEYVALGHVHKPQALGGLAHVRYSGSIERLASDERGDRKGGVLVEIGPEGRRGEPEWLPLEATPFLDVEIRNPSETLPSLGADLPDAARALVRVRATYTPGVDDPDAIHRRIDEVFPRCYRREVVVARPVGNDRGGEVAPASRGLRETVIDYLKARLEGHELADAVLAEAEALVAEARP
jgi:DNA repair exonuclease SbcCD nuclease subunit